MRVSVAVMAHPKRQHHVDGYLLPRLDVEPAVVWDRYGDRWDTGRRALLAYDETADYHVVIQDDTLVSARLAAGVAALAGYVPAGSPIGLYYGSIKPKRPGIARLWERAETEGACWAVLNDSPMWGVGLAFPVGYLDGLVEAADEYRNLASYDRRVARVYQGVDQWFPLPSPVDHRSHGEPSLVQGRSNNRRVAYSFLGEDVCAADRDWTGPVVTSLAQGNYAGARHRRQ